jgi:predicted nucleotidyltransferase
MTGRTTILRFVYIALRPFMLPNSKRTALQDALRDEDAVALAYLFGSHAEGRADAASDVDVAVVRTDEDNALRRVVDLTKALETVIDRPVDVTLIAVQGTDPRLLGQVLRHGKCLFARDEAIRVEFETRARSKYLDMRPHIEEYDRRVREALTR